jgi:hypothetical protein
LWHDIDVYEFDLSASNGRFSGAAKTYVSIGGLAEAAEALKGFPRELSDVGELQFGAFGRESAGGAVHLRFFCIDGAGHAVVELRFKSASDCYSNLSGDGPIQSAQFVAEIEENAVDDFVAELRLSEENRSGAASLRFTDLLTC